MPRTVRPRRESTAAEGNGRSSTRCHRGACLHCPEVTVVLAVVAGFLAARLLWLLLRPSLGDGQFLRENHRGALLPTAAGIVLPLAVVVVEGGRVVAGAAGVGADRQLPPDRLGLLVLCLGFGFLGLLDDLGGSGADRGFSGHLRALARGRLTTGGAKLIGGLAVALLAVGTARPVDPTGLARIAADTALVALAANLGNLFDRAPGRAIKVGAAAFVALAAVTALSTDLAPAAVVVGAALGLLLDDLREHLMLGDTGANVLGAAIGLAAVVACAPGTRSIVLATLVAANLVSEFVSFTRVIDAVPPLRALDRAGRLRG